MPHARRLVRLVVMHPLHSPTLTLALSSAPRLMAWGGMSTLSSAPPAMRPSSASSSALPAMRPSSVLSSALPSIHSQRSSVLSRALPSMSSPRSSVLSRALPSMNSRSLAVFGNLKIQNRVKITQAA